MKYAVVAVTDGNFNIHTEGHESVDDARKSFYGYCQALLNDTSTIMATVRIVDENLNGVEGEKYKATITHPVPQQS